LAVPRKRGRGATLCKDPALNLGTTFWLRPASLAPFDARALGAMLQWRHGVRMVTSLPLEIDRPIDAGIAAFCDNCPGRAGSSVRRMPCRITGARKPGSTTWATRVTWSIPAGVSLTSRSTTIARFACRARLQPQGMGKGLRGREDAALSRGGLERAAHPRGPSAGATACLEPPELLKAASRTRLPLGLTTLRHLPQPWRQRR
jgi:hypothetical protein